LRSKKIMKEIFVLGNDTNAGKTTFSIELYNLIISAGYSAKIIKPIVTGISSPENDLNKLCMIQNCMPETVSLYKFDEPISADIAAKKNNSVIELSHMVEFVNSCEETDFLIIESIGGVMSPINDTETCLDFALNFQSINILVINTELGTISKTLCAITASRAKKLNINYIVISNTSDYPIEYINEIATSIKNHVPKCPKILILPRINDGKYPDKSIECLREIMGVGE
jgi:dethiobiotin synthetase